MELTHIHHSDSRRDWLPAHNGILQPHPVCRICGAVKNISPDRGRGFGYYINVLAEIKKHLELRGKKLSKIQIRLIIKELEKNSHFADIYVIPGSVQRSIFIDAVRKYTGLSRSFIESFL